MAKAKAIDPNTLYRVNLAGSIQVGRRAVHPGPNVKLLGEVLEAVIAADPNVVKSYEPAPEVAE